VFKVSLYDMNNAIEEKDRKEHYLEEIVPEQYHALVPLLNEVLAHRVRPDRPGIGHEDRLKHRETPTWGPFNSILSAELVVLKEGLKENMSKGLIQQSSLPFAAPVLFAKKLGGALRFCIHYRDINIKTIMNHYQLPLIKETLNLQRKTRIYTKLDVRGADN